MAKRTNVELLRDILAQVGGADNIQSATNCMTRMRIRVKDETQVNQEALKDVEGVMGVVDAETLQIVVGPGTAKKVTDLLIEEHGIAEDSVRDSTSAVSEDWRSTKQDVKDSQQKVQMLEGENEIQQQEIKILAPKAKYTDDVLQSSSTFTTTQVAQGLGMTAQKLNKKLQELGVQYRQSGQWLLKGRYKDMGIAKVRVHTYFNEATEKHVTTQALVWTEKGRLFLHHKRDKGEI